ncbi:cation:proton antiporter [Acidianus brierleyi]|nr:cation:proton antiporter [Acidianus brierleyi]
MNVLIITLLYLGIMLFLAKLAEELFSRLGLIPFVGAIFIGIILGEGVTDFIKVNEIISFITSLGIVFLLFLAGAEEINMEQKLDKKLVLTSIIQITIPFSLVLVVLYILNVPHYLILIIPLIMTSAGPLTRLLIDLGITKSEFGVNLFYQATIVEIISVILFAIFLGINGNLLYTALEIIAIFVLIFALGPFLSRLLEKIEGYIKVREIEFASIISLILIIGFLSEILKFNSAIAALFLGFLLRRYLKDRPELLEKLHGFTYGFFEPLFFVSIGLFFVKIDYQILIIGSILFIVIFISKFSAGIISSMIIKNNLFLNGLGTSTKGGVDASLLISALTINAITPSEYSYSALAITFSALFIPLLFKLRSGYKVERKEKIKLNTKVSLILSQFSSPIFANCNETLREAINKINEKNARALVVVSDMKPVGIITVSKLLEISPDYYDKLRLCDMELDDIDIMPLDSKISDILKKFRETETPVIAIVDKDHRLQLTIYERELLRFLIT